MKLRVGRKVLRNLYVQVGDEPSDMDLDIGRMDSAAMAGLIVRLVNRHQEELTELMHAMGRGLQDDD